MLTTVFVGGFLFYSFGPSCYLATCRRIKFRRATNYAHLVYISCDKFLCLDGMDSSIDLEYIAKIDALRESISLLDSKSVRSILDFFGPTPIRSRLLKVRTH